MEDGRVAWFPSPAAPTKREKSKEAKPKTNKLRSSNSVQREHSEHGKRKSELKDRSRSVKHRQEQIHDKGKGK
jgi:hypothetical protein